jgi:hypothetical protein
VIDPGPFTLAELWARAKALDARAWAHTAWIAYHAVAPHMKKDSNLKPADFYPHPEEEPFDVKESDKQVEKWVEDGLLPKKLTEAEIEARWQYFLRKEEERGRR